MKVLLLLLCLAALSPLTRSVAAACDTPPHNITDHLQWCATAADDAARLARYEGFWKRFDPNNHGYEDGVHITQVRLCAYRLAALYAQTGNTKRCREMLQWLEAGDERLR
jgi:hypothetical protein